MKEVKVVTVSRVPVDVAYPNSYYRISLYKFEGEEPKAVFQEDFGVGFWDFDEACRRAKIFAKDLDVLFIKNIQMGDSIQKVYHHVLSD